MGWGWVCMRRQNHWGAAGLEPQTCLVTDVLAGACVLGKRSVFWTRKGTGVSSLGLREAQGIWTPEFLVLWAGC